MGLNLVIGCHICRTRLWFYSGGIEGIEAFYRDHWPDDARLKHDIELSDDQASAEWVWGSDYKEEVSISLRDL